MLTIYNLLLFCLRFLNATHYSCNATKLVHRVPRTLFPTGCLATERWSFRRSQPWTTLGLQPWFLRRSQPRPIFGPWSLRRSQPLISSSKYRRDSSRLSHSSSYHILVITYLFTNLITSVSPPFRPRPDSGTYYELLLSIDFIHSAEVAHCAHTTEPMASSSHSGGPTTFRRNQPTAMTLSRPLRPNPQWASPGWPHVYQRHTDHRRGQNNPTRGLVPKISKTITQGYVRLPDQGKHAHNLSKWKAPARGHDNSSH